VIYAPTNSNSEFLDQLGKPLLGAVEAPWRETYTVTEPGITSQNPNRAGNDAATTDAAADVRIENKTYFLPANGREALSRTRVDTAAGMQIDMNADAQVAAGGALCAILAKEGVLGSSQDDGRYRLSVVQEMRLDGFLFVDTMTQQGLQIIQQESHPSAMGIGRSKEGHSLFGLLDNCVTQTGRSLLRLWIMRPLLNKAVIESRLDTIQQLINNPESAAQIRKALKQIKDVPRIMRRLVSLQANPCLADFKALKDSFNGFMHLREALAQAVHSAASIGDRRQAQSQGSPVFQKLMGCIQQDDIRGCQRLICEVIDFDEEADTVSIQQGVCDQLDRLRSVLNELPDFLTEVMKEELARVPRGLLRQTSQQTWSILYVPQVGFMVRIAGEKLSPILEAEFPDYRLMFDSAGEEPDDEMSFFYVCDRTNELNLEFGDMQNVIADMETCICTELIQRLAQFSHPMRLASAAAAEADCLLSLSVAAVNNNYHRPEISEDAILDIKNGRHMLAEHIVEDIFVPNDTTMGASSGRIHVITGPNVSGKSCYMRQVALITFLAHIGSFVPADKAIIGLTDRIMSLVPYQDVSGAHASSFMVDLNQISAMLHHSSHQSLLLIDEFGRGTNTNDGVALFTAVLRAFAGKSRPPRLLACTHFGQELQDVNCLPRMPAISNFHMSVIHDDSRRALEKQMFLYKLVPGWQIQSFGLHCACQAHVPQPIISRAADVIAHLQDGRDLYVPCPEEQRRFFAKCINLVRELANLTIDNGDALLAYLSSVAECSQQH